MRADHDISPIAFVAAGMPPANAAAVDASVADDLPSIGPRHGSDDRRPAIACGAGERRARGMSGLSLAACLVAASLLLAACASRPVATEPPAPPPSPPAPPMVEQFQADSLFAFGKAGIDDVSEQGLASLDALAERLLQIAQPLKVDVIGHSDRIGNPRVNADLSHRRARAVREYLIALGVAPETISASGRGSAEPVVECPDQRGQALIACLAPNRRVDVHIRYEP